MSKPTDMGIENTNNVGVEKAHAQQREREGSESDTIIADGSGTVKHPSGMTVDTHYAAQLRPSRLTGRGLTFMVSYQVCFEYQADVRLLLLLELDLRCSDMTKVSCLVF
jgi:hypothetical protein